MTTAGIAWRRASGVRLWSLAALVLCAGGVVATVAVVLGSNQDPASVRWPLVIAPLVAAALPVAFPSRRVRIAAAVVFGAWCLLAAASVGLFFVPAALVSTWAAAHPRARGRGVTRR